MKKSKRRLANRDYHKSGPMHRGMSDRFTIFGQTVPRIAIINGIVLFIWGIISFGIAGFDWDAKTALIPTAMGTPMLLMGILSERNESNSHHYMHACMVLALVMVISPISMFGMMGIPESPLALLSNLLLIQVGISFIIIGIKSFRHARLLREAGN